MYLACSGGIIFVFFCGTLNNSSTGDTSVVVASEGFSIPFEDGIKFTISSEFGDRLDPFGSEDTVFHNGIDLATAEGTNIVATEDGIVYETGFQENGLGNYVYIKHETEEMGVIFSVYGHMLDDSIIVEQNQKVLKGEKIGEVGQTGLTTGNHLHFMIMKEKISYERENLLDPIYIVTGLEVEEI